MPDAPVSRFELRLRGGGRGLIQNSKNLCRSKPVADVQLTAQNSKVADSKIRIATSCRHKKKAKRHAKDGRH